MPRISAKRMQDREDTLALAARKVFAEKGFQQASIGDVAREAQVSDGLLYRYFNSKRDLLLAVLSPFYGRLIEGIEQGLNDTACPAEQFSALVRQHLEVFLSDIDLCRLFIKEVRNFDDYASSEEHELNRRYTSILLRIIENGVAKGHFRDDVDPRLIRDMVFGGIEHIAWRRVVGGQAIEVDRTAEQIASLFLSGVIKSASR
jgi:TetR/AcrR family fatty acid metabolism transcriptional regulator